MFILNGITKLFMLGTLTLYEQNSIVFICLLWKAVRWDPGGWDFVASLIQDHCADFPDHVSTYWITARCSLSDGTCLDDIFMCPNDDVSPEPAWAA